jgi:hypothetical protein
VTPVQATGTMPSSEPGSVLLGGLARTAWLQVTDDEGISRPLAFMGQWQDPVPMARWIDPITTAMFQLYGDGSIESPVRTDEGHGHDRNRGVSAALRTVICTCPATQELIIIHGSTTACVNATDAPISWASVMTICECPPPQDLLIIHGSMTACMTTTDAPPQMVLANH